MRLSLHARPGTKVFLTVVLLALVAGAAAFADVAYQSVVAVEETDPWAADAGVTRFIDFFIVGLPLIVAAVGCFALLAVLRAGARLDGTVVTLRRTFTTITVDLATAESFWFDEQVRRHSSDGHRVTRTYTIPLLCARTPDGRTVEIPLSNGERRLPPPEPAALAEAIERGGSTGDRAAVAAELRTWSTRLPN